MAAAARAAGGVSDAQVVGDIDAAAKLLRRQPYANGKVGIIGFCSGGRQAYMLACKLDSIDAAVDCWGGRVIPTAEDITPLRPEPVIDMTPNMRVPLLGIFGNDDANPDVEQVNRTEAELKRHGKDYEFHRYDGAGHGFFATDRPNYRQEQAVDGWKKVFAFYEKHLTVSGAHSRGNTQLTVPNQARPYGTDRPTASASWRLVVRHQIRYTMGQRRGRWSCSRVDCAANQAWGTSTRPPSAASSWRLG